MTLYHWTFSAEKILKSGFRGDLGICGGRHIRDDGVWFSDEILGPLDGVEEGMKLLVIEIPFKDIEEFESSKIEETVKAWIAEKELSFGKVMPPLRLVIVFLIPVQHHRCIRYEIDQPEATPFYERLVFVVR